MKRSVTRNHRTNLRLETLEQRHLLTGLPVISEFMASNRDSLLDGDTPPGSPDWIELYNAGDYLAVSVEKAVVEEESCLLCSLGHRRCPAGETKE